MGDNQKTRFFGAALMLLSISGCVSDQSSQMSSPSQPKKAEQTSQPAESQSPKQSLVGKASWYGPGFYGQKTTSGDVLEKGTMTAAHSSLPMGTQVKVTRLDTNETVTVEINDRKPYKEGTLIDLAHGAAEELDLDDDGTAQVRIEVLD